MSTFNEEIIQGSIESFSEYAKFDDLNELIEEAKRRFLHRSLQDNDYSLHRTAKSLGYASVNSTILTLFELEDSYLKSSHLKDFFENDYSPNASNEAEQKQLISFLSNSQSRKEFDDRHAALEKTFFEIALKTHNGNHTLTAEQLDMGRKTISRKIKKYKIDVPETPAVTIEEPAADLPQVDIEYHSEDIIKAAGTYPHLKTSHDHARRHMMMQAYKKYDGNITHASQSLGWTRASFRENYTRLFEKEKFEAETVNSDFEKWQNAMSDETEEVKNTTILFIEHSRSIKNVQALFECAKAQIIQSTLEDHDNNKAAASKVIGLNRTTVAHHLKKETATTPPSVQKSVETGEKENVDSETKPEKTETTAKTAPPKPKEISSKWESEIVISPNAPNEQSATTSPKSEMNPKSVSAPDSPPTSIPTENNKAEPQKMEKFAKRVSPRTEEIKKKWASDTVIQTKDKNEQPVQNKPAKVISPRLASLAQSLSEHFEFTNIFEMKERTNKALIADTLNATDFDLPKSAEKLGITENTLHSLISNHFKILHVSVEAEARYLRRLREAVQELDTSESEYKGEIRDILPEVKTMSDVSECFTHASKHIVTNEWLKNQKDTEKTAQALQISSQMLEAMILT